ncbi:MAG: RNA polymerase sigma factor, partial [Clostridia bacterium]|nr:RNA polymerase sigma factor [Clostridia bacterium]
LWRTLPSYRFECPILSYALQITRNTVLDLLRRKRARGETVSLTVEEEDGEAAVLDIADPDEASDPARAYASEERMSEVRRALGDLPIELREILTLRAIEGMSYEQIGQVLSLEEGTVKSRLSRARKKLEEILKSRNIFE